MRTYWAFTLCLVLYCMSTSVAYTQVLPSIQVAKEKHEKHATAKQERILAEKKVATLLSQIEEAKAAVLEQQEKEAVAEREAKEAQTKAMKDLATLESALEASRKALDGQAPKDSPSPPSLDPQPDKQVEKDPMKVVFGQTTNTLGKGPLEKQPPFKPDSMNEKEKISIADLQAKRKSAPLLFTPDGKKIDPGADDEEVKKNDLQLKGPPAKGTILVNLHPQARLWIQDQLTTSIGSARRFETIPLPLGKRYSYNLKAVLPDNSVIEKTVEVTPGQESTITLQ